MSSHFSPNFLHNSTLVTNTDLMCSDNLSTVRFSQFSADRNVSLILQQIETYAFGAAYNAWVTKVISVAFTNAGEQTSHDKKK